MCKISQPGPQIEQANTKWWIYIISCSQGSYYTGITKNIERRFKEHTAQGKKCAKYLRGRGTLTIVFADFVGNHQAALRIERQIKSFSKKQKQGLIEQGNLNSLLELGS